jgi:hypothetical protein
VASSRRLLNSVPIKIIISQSSTANIRLVPVSQTIEDGFNSGRRYIHRMPEEEVYDWHVELKELVSTAKIRERERAMRAAHGSHTIAYYRAWCLQIYESRRMQYMLAVLIMLAFAIDLGEAQILPEDGDWYLSMFQTSEIVLTGLFTVELCVHLFAKSNDYCRPFWSNMMNNFDFLVVAISILSIIFRDTAEENGFPSLKMFRLVRIVRVLRLFKRFEALNKIMSALSSSLIPVCNSLFVLLIFTSIYATLATHLLRDRSAQFFGNFAASFFTMIQVMLQVHRNAWHQRGRGGGRKGSDDG